MRTFAIALAALLIATLASAAVPLETYLATLRQTRALLASGNVEAARAEAKTMIGADIASPRGSFHADDALLGAIDVRSARRLDATIADLQRVAPAPAAAVDPKLLDRLARDEAPRKLREDGSRGDDAIDGSTLAAFNDHWARATTWIMKKIADFFDWLDTFWPKKKLDAKKPANIRSIVIAVAVLIVLIIAILAFEALRRSRAAAKDIAVSIAPAASSRDEDPLSRTTNEWEVYAEKLARAGRHREAIRAWYHAVLVTLYGAAILHFRRGRTNWEYVAALAPSLPWRGEFIALTRRFESEWYGHDESSADALDDCSERAKTILDSVRRTARGAA